MDLDGDEVQSVRSVCTLSLQEIGAQISEHPMPQQIDRNGVWIDIWPEHWGMTMRQIRKLMNECKDDPDWHQNNSVRDMVKHHILPRTAGTGLGYALKVNHESTLEVAVLVSHSWNENAEEFVETLERTVGADEVLFVCAFAIYQNEDGAGPTVSQQIGASMNCSPFGRVLKNIQEQAHKAGWWWWPRGTIYLVPGVDVGDHSNHAAGHCLARQCYSSVILNGTASGILCTGLHLGLFSVHAADVGDIASNGVFAAQTPPCAWPAAVGYWRFSGGDSGLVGARRAQSLPRCCRSYGLRIHNVCNIEPFSAFDKDSKIWRPLEGYFSFNGGCADVASFLRSVCCVPTRASLELSKSQLAIPVCICPADLGPQHWPTFAGLLHLVFPFGMGGSNADCGQRSVCD